MAVVQEDDLPMIHKLEAIMVTQNEFTTIMSGDRAQNSDNNGRKRLNLTSMKRSKQWFEDACSAEREHHR